MRGLRSVWAGAGQCGSQDAAGEVIQRGGDILGDVTLWGGGDTTCSVGANYQTVLRACRGPGRRGPPPGEWRVACLQQGDTALGWSRLLANLDAVLPAWASGSTAEPREP